MNTGPFGPEVDAPLTHATEAADSGEQARVRIWILALAALFLLLGFPLAASTGYRGSGDLHSALEVCGGLFGMIAGLALVMRCYTEGNRLHLFLGLAFLVNGGEDLIHGVVSFRDGFGLGEAALARFIPATYVTGRIMFALLLLLAPFLARALGSSRNPRRETVLASSLALVAAMLMTALVATLDVPSLQFPERLLSRPVDFGAALLMTGALGVLLREYRIRRDPIIWWVGLSVLANVMGQLLMALSKGLYDPWFDLAHLYKTVGYVLPVVGIALYQTRLLTLARARHGELVRHHAQMDRLVQERVKEQQCLYRVAEITRDVDRPPDQTLEEVVNALPDGFQFPGLAEARIRFNGEEHRTEGFQETGPSLVRELPAAGAAQGTVEVRYPETAGGGESPDFLQEEEQLLDQVAQQVARFLEGRGVHLALIESEGRFRRLAENAADMIYRMRLPDGTYEYVSPASEDIWGYTAEEVYANPLLIAQCIHPDWEDYFKKEWEKLLKGEPPPTYAYRIIAKDGTEKWLFQRNTLVKNDEGTPIALEGIVTDVTDRIDAEERFRQLFELSADMVCVADLDGYFRLLNPAWERVLGYTHEELTGTPFFDFIHPEDKEPTHQVVQDKLEQGETVLSFRNRYLAKDGRVVWLDWTSQPDLAKGQTFAIARDITEQKAVEDQVAELVERLKGSNQELEQFAYVASHDLQEPLRMISSYTQLLDQRYGEALDADASEFMGFVIDGANRMRALINDLLEYSRVSTRGQEMEQIEACDAFGRAMSHLQPLIREAGGLVTNGDLPTVMADEGQLVRVFQNLVANAIKFRGEEPVRVHVDAVRDHGGWTFSVQDNGIGIDPQYAERIFQIFQRLHGRGKYEGTGIGLAVCRRIIERHGGRIWCESEPGSGSTFKFTLPAVLD